MEYTRSPVTVGELAEAYVENTTALRQSNNKLRTICLAARRCEEGISR